MRGEVRGNEMLDDGNILAPAWRYPGYPSDNLEGPSDS